MISCIIFKIYVNAFFSPNLSLYWHVRMTPDVMSLHSLTSHFRSTAWPCFKWNCTVKLNADHKDNLQFILHPLVESKIMGITEWNQAPEGDEFDPRLKGASWLWMQWRPCLTLSLWLNHNIDFFFTRGRFSLLGSSVAWLWPSLSSQKTIIKPLLPRHWQGQGWRWIVEDYYFHSGIQFKQAPGRKKWAEEPGYGRKRREGWLLVNFISSSLP